MLVKQFKFSYPKNILILIFLALAVQIPCFIFPNINVEINSSAPIMRLVSSLFNFSPLLTGILFSVFLGVTILIIDKTNKDNILISKTSLLPPAVYSILFGLSLYNSNIILGLLLSACICRLLEIATKERSFENYYMSSGVFAGIAFLMDINAYIVLLIIIISLFITKRFNLRYLLIILTGFILPILIWVIILFFQNRLEELIFFLQTLKINFAFFHFEYSTSKLIYLIAFVIIILFSSIFVFLKFNTMNNPTKTKYSLLIFVTLSCLLLVFISNNPLFYIMLSFPALSILISFVLNNLKLLYADIFFSLLLLLPILLLF